ncbi:MAG: ethylbenzene dehydrogenase-related protein [Phaeospirillum sp.]|nr:ethylbenzene dehydrogenase-related protein [Phaeospirillum sp.]
MAHFLTKALASAVATGMIGVMAASAQAAEPDWSKVPVKSVKLFYPGQSSSQWLRSTEHKQGNKQVPAGRACVSCHENDETDIGNVVVKGGRLEPNPIPGKQGTIDLAVQAAYDSKNAYLRFQWKTRNPHPGDAHPYLRFNGKEWKSYGGPRLDGDVREAKQPALYEDRLALMIDDGKVENFAVHGCWVTCHDGLRDMPKAAKPEDVAANPLLGQTLKKSEVRKFLPPTRTGESWDSTRSPDEIAKLKAAGGFLDLMQWRAHRSNPVGMADDGYVLEYRLSDDGKDVFASNKDKKTHQPKYMYDAKKVGVKAIRTEDLHQPGKPQHLILETNGVAFDPMAGWKDGDMIPEYVVSRAQAAGSAADNADVKGVWKDGMWTVVWVRPLNLANPDDKAFREGGVYNVGMAVHDDNITTRGHHVSFPVSLGFGAKADIQAVKVE